MAALAARLEQERKALADATKNDDVRGTCVTSHMGWMCDVYLYSWLYEHAPQSRSTHACFATDHRVFEWALVFIRGHTRVLDGAEATPAAPDVETTCKS